MMTMHVVNYKNCLIIECDLCGEKFYTDEVAEISDKIISAAKKFSQEISVIDYQLAT